MTQRELEMRNEILEKRVQLLEKYLKLATQDIDVCCNNQKGFLQISNPMHHEICYENDLWGTLTKDEKRLVKKLGLNTVSTTHQYKYGTYEWRYKQEVESLLKEVI